MSTSKAEEERLKFKFHKSIAFNSKINLEYTTLQAIIDDTFDVFKSVKNEYLIFFSIRENFKKYSLICYNIKLDQVNTKIAQAHEDRIYTCRHFLDKNTNSDLIITGSFDRYIKIWNITNNFTLQYKKIPDYNYKENTYLLSENLLFYNKTNYLITSAYEMYSTGYNILFYDYENSNKMNNLNNSKDNSNYICIYYENDCPYILAGNYKNVKIFNFEKKNLVKMYHDNHKEINYLSVIITKNKDNNKVVISSGADGYLRIWNYDSKDILSKMSNNHGKWLVGICLINEKYIFAGTLNDSIEEYSLISNKIVYELKKEGEEERANRGFLCIKNIDVDKDNYLVSHSYNGFIDLWLKTD